MSQRDNDRFRPRPGSPKSDAASQPQRLISRVLKEVSRAGAVPIRSRGSSDFGRGRVAARLHGSALGARARRVVIKSRFVVLKRAGRKSTSTHLRYIEREGVTREGDRGRAYGPDTDAADLKAFEQRGCGDRHQFRLIVSVEDAGHLEDLRRFTRDFMRQVSVDLESRLDWVAVDHWDTGNPHTHIVLRGRAEDGRDLVIAPEYMAHGMRQRASDVATTWLGPRTELEMQQSLRKEVEQERLTNLDRMLLRGTRDGAVDLSDWRNRPIALHLRRRLGRLARMGLVRRLDNERWSLSPDLEVTLRAMGERGDILRAVQKALRGESREIRHDLHPEAPVTGMILDKGLDDELSDRGYLVVDGVDGRAHYVRLPAGSEISEYPIGGVVQVACRPRGSDTRASAGRAVSVTLESHLTVEEQVTSKGATWLDRQLVKSEQSELPYGFGAHVREAMDRRSEWLVENGYAVRRGGKLALSPQMLSVLEELDVRAAGEALAGRLRNPYVHARPGAKVSGTVRESVLLDSGKFAVVETSGAFSLVPWSENTKLGRVLDGRPSRGRSGLSRGLDR